MKLLYGTSNQSKIDTMREHIAPLGIEILSLNDISAPDIEIDESGTHPLENARIKALAYYNALKTPVFSCDSGLYFGQLSLDDPRQPGVHVRRINGRRLNDEEMTAHYSALAKEFGGSITARYINSICLVLDNGVIHEHAGQDIASEPFKIVAKPHHKRSPGFPIDCLSVHIESGMYYYDIPNYMEKYFGIADGFAAFFSQKIFGRCAG